MYISIFVVYYTVYLNLALHLYPGDDEAVHVDIVLAPAPQLLLQQLTARPHLHTRIKLVKTLVYNLTHILKIIVYFSCNPMCYFYILNQKTGF